MTHMTPRHAERHDSEVRHRRARAPRAARREVGSGYTSIWLLQALADNEAELARYAEIRGAIHGEAYLVADAVAAGARGGDACLYCVDNEAHEHETASEISRVAARLGLEVGSS